MNVFIKSFVSVTLFQISDKADDYLLSINNKKAEGQKSWCACASHSIQFCPVEGMRLDFSKAITV